MKPDKGGSYDNPYAARRARELARMVKNGEVLVEEGYGGYFYRPREILMALADEQLLAPRLREEGARPHRKRNRELERRRLGARVWLLPRRKSLPEAVERLRRPEGDRQPRVGPNHVFGAEVLWGWGGGGAPVAVAPLALPASPVTAEKAAVGVVDTGMAEDTPQLHPGLFDHLTDPTGDTDVLDDDGDGLLDSGAGHGTFVLGVIYQLDPDLTLDVEPGLGSHGFGDDLSVATAISELATGVINLSFGGYTHDNMEPVGLRSALDVASRNTVFVAAAGNHGRSEPCWPAAFSDVVAVAALDTRTDGAVPASFTNHGEWVDVCAPGVDIHSTYVEGTWPDDGIEFSGWARWSGTSFAAPQVAAAIARLALDKGITPHEAKDQLLAGLDPFPDALKLGLRYIPPKDLVFRP
jgi:Subtilase family